MDITSWADRVKRKAFELKVSDVSIAETVGISPSTVSLWMNGKRVPKLEQKLKIAELLGVSLSWLDTGRDILPDNHLPILLLEELRDFYLQSRSRSQYHKELTGNPGRQITELEDNHSGLLIEMLNDSMMNGTRADVLEIPEGALIQVDVDCEPKPGEIILVEHDGEIKLRLWKQIGAKTHSLRVINGAYPELNISYEGDISKIHRGTCIAFSKSLRR